MAVTQLGEKELGSLVKLNENGVLVEFYVARHDYERELNGAGRTLLVRKDCYDKHQWHSSNVNAYASSAIDSWLNSTYKNLLDANIRAAMGVTKIQYTPGNGNWNVATLERSVFLMSITELDKVSTGLKAEGTALSGTVLNLLKTAYLNGYNIHQWTRSPRADDASSAWSLHSDTLYYNYCTDTYGVRPVFTLPSSSLVFDDGAVKANMAPTIASTSNVPGVNLGSKSEAFSFQYTPSDADGDRLTVTERLDGVVQKTRTDVASGTKLTFECVSHAVNFQRILNGRHTLTVEADDGVVAADPLSVTFTKEVYHASITLKEPLPADTQPTAIWLEISGSIPKDSIWSVQVCNNAYDADPAWENIKSSVQNGRNYIFKNKANVVGRWGVNFRITVQRGSADSGGYITGIQGGFAVLSGEGR